MEHRERNNTMLYARVLGRILSHGGFNRTGSRLGDTYELHPVLFGVSNPHEPVPFVNGRRPNYFGMLAESLWLLSDTDSVDVISTWNQKLRDYTDDGIHLSGAYGRRISPFVSRVIHTLKEDPNTRQAVLPIFEGWDVGSKTRDLPCNVMVMFKVRRGMLDITVINRSNDVLWGAFTVNIPQFAMLQSAIAGELGLPVGQQWHMSDSLHLYTDYAEQSRTLERMKSHYGGGAYLSYLNAYDIWPFPRNRQYVPRYDGEYMSRLLLDWSRGNRPLENGEFISKVYDSVFLRFAEVLLTGYASYRKNKTNRSEFMRDMCRDLVAPDIRRWCGEGALIPFDWVLGCLTTLVKDETTADLCVDIMYEICASYGMPLNEDQHKAIGTYLEVEIGNVTS